MYTNEKKKNEIKCVSLPTVLVSDIFFSNLQITIGDETFGYYETVAGGSGAVNNSFINYIFFLLRVFSFIS